MTSPPDGTSLGWDALVAAPGGDALAVTDPLSATSFTPSADALAVGYRADALAAGHRADALAAGYGGAALGDPPATPAFGDSLTAYGDATAADRRDTGPSQGRGITRPGPVPPAGLTDDDRSPEDAGSGRVGGQVAGTGKAATGRPGDRSSAARSRAARTGRPRPVARPRPGGASAGAGRAGQPGAAGTAAQGGRQPGAGSGTAAAAQGGRQPGAGSGTGAAARRQGPTWEELGRIGAQGRGGAPAPRDRYGRPPHEVAGPHGQGPVRTPPPRPNRTSRPTGTVPWAGRSGWDDFFAGTGGTSGGSGKQRSGAEVARALLEAFRRSRRGR